jgi:serine protease SohB
LEFLTTYGLFFAKSATIVIAIIIVIVAIVAASSRGRKEQEGHIEVNALNEKYEDYEEILQHSILDDQDLKQLAKEKKKQDKLDKKKHKHGKDDEARKKRVYVLDFIGDTKASALSSLREEVTAVLTMAEKQDEVVIRLESPGGMVHTYGLAASQLQRIRNHDIPLTIAVDAVAASGGYMMACIGNKILAAPFAILGSIGVVAQLPNFHRLLKKNDIDFELFTAGEHKRTVTMFGENTDKGREKFSEELEDTHQLFKSFVSEHRPQVNISEVATGEIWYGQRAIENNLVDDIQTSDEYLMSMRKEADLYTISYTHKKSFQEKLGFAAENGISNGIEKAIASLGNKRLFK